MIIRKSNAKDIREQFEICLISFAGIIDGLVCCLSFGFLSSNIRPWLLFSSPDWLIRDP